MTVFETEILSPAEAQERNIRTWKVWTCDDPECRCVHVALQNFAGDARAQMVISREAFDTFCADVNEQFASLAS